MHGFPRIAVLSLLSLTLPIHSIDWNGLYPNRENAKVYTFLAGIAAGTALARYWQGNAYQNALNYFNHRTISSRQKKLLAYRHRIQLLPAITPVAPVIIHQAIAATRTQAHTLNRRLKTDQNYDALRKILTNSDINRDNAPIAVYAHRVSPTVPDRTVDLLAQQQNNPAQLLFKNDPGIEPRALFGTPLLREEVGFVVYSDGDIQIKLSDADRQALDNLTGEQFSFIQNLSVRRNSYQLNFSDSAIFNSLSPAMQSILRRHYAGGQGLATIGEFAVDNAGRLTKTIVLTTGAIILTYYAAKIPLAIGRSVLRVLKGIGNSIRLAFV